MAAVRRTYLAGIGAGVSLLAGGALLFMVLSALVAFDAVPSDGDADADVVRSAEVPEGAVLAATGIAADVPAQITTALAVESTAPTSEAAAAPPRTLGSPPAQSLPRATETPSSPGTESVPVLTPRVDQTRRPDTSTPTATEQLTQGLDQIVDDGGGNLDKVLEDAGDTVNGLLRGDSRATTDGLRSTVKGTGKTVDDALEGTGSTVQGTLGAGK